MLFVAGCASDAGDVGYDQSKGVGGSVLEGGGGLETLLVFPICLLVK